MTRWKNEGLLINNSLFDRQLRGLEGDGMIEENFKKASRILQRKNHITDVMSRLTEVSHDENREFEQRLDIQFWLLRELKGHIFEVLKKLDKEFGDL